MADAAVIYVNQFASGNNTGLDWVNAYTDLQSALAAAQAGDEIWVVSGDYYPTDDLDRSATFSIPTGVAVYGGFVGAETQKDQRDPAAFPTFLNGNIGNPASTSDNTYTIVTITDPDSMNVLDGLSIVNGNADNRELPAPFDLSRRGGGVAVLTSGTDQIYHLTIQNCFFSGNEAEYGGALYSDGTNHNYVALQLINCTFERNYAELGAVYATDRGDAGLPGIRIEHCTFQRNETSVGGMIYLLLDGEKEGSLVIQDCDFLENRNNLLNIQPKDPDIPFHFRVKRSRFVGNEHSGGSEGIITYQSRNLTDFLMDSVLFQDNVYRGSLLGLGFMHRSVIMNTQFEANAGDRMIEAFSDTVVLANCQFTMNNGGLLIRAQDLSIHQTDFTNNIATQLMWLHRPNNIPAGSRIRINDCTFTGNEADKYWAMGADTARIDRVYVLDDQPAEAGGMELYGNQLTFSNSLFARTASGPLKAAIRNRQENGELNFTNCTFYNYVEDDSGILLRSDEREAEDAVVRFRNSILWDDRPEAHLLFSLHNTQVELQNSLISQTDCSSTYEIFNPMGEPNVSGDVLCDTTNLLGIAPLFADTALHDFGLDPCSPAIDRGNNAWLPPEVIDDLSGEPRLFGAAIDLGAFELQIPANQLTIESEVIPASTPEAADASINITAVNGGIPDYTYDWSLGNGGPVLSELQEGIYSLTITDQLGCSGEFIFEVGTLDAVVDPAVEWGVRLWPNPVGKAGNSKLLIGAQTANLNRVRLYGAQGRLIWQQAIEQAAEVELPSVLQSGWYLVQITDREGRHGYLKWIVQ
jgi:predicted outer membrane repeat protein